MKKFEFKVVHVYLAWEVVITGQKEDVPRYESGNEKPALNDLGAEGWELIAIYPHNHTQSDKRWYVGFFQREISE